MAGIGTIKIAYKAPQLWRSLASYKKRPVERIRNEDLSRYILPSVTLEILKRRNIVFSIGDQKIESHHPMDVSNAFMDEILFSSQSNEISTNAGACSSYILFCEKMRIATAVHVASVHLKDRLFHRNMLLYAYANLRQMAPKDRISAYISGMDDFLGPELAFTRNLMKEHYGILLLSALEELMGRGVRIRTIDIGDHYSRQIFSPMTGEYKTFLSPFE